jgi:hypothetical protein
LELEMTLLGVTAIEDRLQGDIDINVMLFVTFMC